MRFAAILTIALFAAMLAAPISLLRAAPAHTQTAADHPCGPNCICGVDMSCGCIEEAPATPQPAPQAPAPNQNRTQWHFSLPHNIGVETNAVPAVAKIEVNPTHRIVGGFLIDGRVNDALAMISVWRT